MKIYNFAIPILIALFVNHAEPTTCTDVSEVLEPSAEVMDAIYDTGKKKGGTMTAEQDFSNCNTCASCDSECIDSPGACIGATIEITSIYCPFYSPQGTITLPGFSQYICSLTQTGPYTFYLEFNAVAYSCSQPDTPFTFDIPIHYTYVCPTTSNTLITGSVNFIIC
ncbi:MAG: hypothetical protein AAGA77_22015 [Bacteroidota bacterium]